MTAAQLLEQFPARSLTVDVIGIPAPQGSKRHVGHGRMVESSKKVGPWRDSVSWAALGAVRAAGWELVDGPVRLDVTFRLARPASAPKKRVYPDRTPDLDKLLRSTLDGLVQAGGVLTDDARVVTITARKEYAAPGEPVGASIVVDVL